MFFSFNTLAEGLLCPITFFNSNFKQFLNEAEQNYVCLYAIGLRGKEIGAYIQIKRHYHMSTDIRKKLGLNQDDTNRDFISVI